MRVIGLLSISLLLVAGMSFAQAQQDQTQPVGTMMEFMYSMVHPASNEILLTVNRGGPQNDKEWADVQRSALQLAESGNLLMMRGRARDQGQRPAQGRACYWHQRRDHRRRITASHFCACRARSSGRCDSTVVPI